MTAPQPARVADTLAQITDMAGIVGAGSYPDAELTAAVSWASSVIRGYTNQHISQVVNDTVALTPAGCVAFLPETPVTAVASVTIKTYDQVTGTPIVTPITAWDWSARGLVFPTIAYQSGWPTGGVDNVIVTYTHGYLVVPQDIVDCATRLAHQWLLNPAFRVEYKIGEKTERFRSDGGSALTPYDTVILDRFALVGVA